MKEEQLKRIEAFKSIWYERFPVHEINADTGEDMFWKTAMMVADDFAAATKREEEVEKLKKGLQWCVDYFQDEFLPEDYLRMQNLLANSEEKIKSKEQSSVSERPSSTSVAAAEVASLEKVFKTAFREIKDLHKETKFERWIDVKDRLPTEKDVCDEYYNEVLTLQVGRRRPTFMKYWELKDCPFTKFWMPLPSPPNSEEKLK